MRVGQQNKVIQRCFPFGYVKVFILKVKTEAPPRHIFVSLMYIDKK